jgi:hypothetical protein
MNLTMGTVERITRLCFHMDHESADPHPRARCVPYFARSGTKDSTRSIEATAQRTLFIVAPPQYVNSGLSRHQQDEIQLYELD